MLFGGLNEDGLRWLIYLNAWFSAGGTVWEGGVTGGGLSGFKSHVFLSSFCLLPHDCYHHFPLDLECIVGSDITPPSPYCKGTVF